MMFKKVLIANRGEIALRIVRACRDLGVRSVVVYSEADRDGLPVLPGSEEPLLNAGQARELAGVLGYPLILKAAGGGGGRGMRVVRSDGEVAEAFALASAEAGAAFRNPELYLERYLLNPRHV